MRCQISRSISLWVVFSIFLTLLAACNSTQPEPQLDVAAAAKATLDARATLEAAVKATLDARQPVTGDAKMWTVMLYEDGDDPILEQDIMTDFNEMERAGSTDQVNIVAQVDRYKGGYKGMGDWSTAKRFYVTQDNDMNSIHSQEIDDLGEVNMSDGNSLTDFIVWAATNYPAQHYALVMSDHGAGWPGGFSDKDNGGIGADKIVLATDVFGGDNLWLMEINRALTAARQQTGIDKFDLIGFDACLMAQIEVFAMLQQHAKFAVASEETEPTLGWAYTNFLRALDRTPTMDGGQLANAVVDAYIDQDQLIVDDAQRKLFVKREFDFEGDTTAAEVADLKKKDVTLAAIDLAAIPNVLTALDDFAVKLSQINQNDAAQARAYAQSYESVFGTDVPRSYLDLDNFAQVAAQISGDSHVADSANTLSAAIHQAVIDERHGPKRPGSSGMAIYFPIPALFNLEDNLGYVDVANEFSAQSQWPNFLAFHAASGAQSENFNGSGGNNPSRASTIRSSQKPLDVAPIKLSAEVARPDQPVTITSKVTGDRLAYLFTFVGRVLPKEQVLLVEDEDFLLADSTKSVDGVKYPDWSTDGVAIDYNWDPIVYTISDGKNAVKALIAPEEYDQSPVYAVEGTYKFVDGSPVIRARLFFQDAKLTKILGYSGQGAQGSLHEITTAPGDQFTVLEQGFTITDTAEPQVHEQDGGTLTFGTQQFTIETAPAASGSYVVGIIAQDLDGNFFPQFESVFVDNKATTSIEGFKPYANETLGFALLYPGQWTVEENLPNQNVLFSSNDANTVVSVARLSFPDAATTADADAQGLQTARDLLSGTQDFQTVTEEQDFLLGGYNGRTQDFTLTYQGQEFYGSIVVATPKTGTTVGFIIIDLKDDFNNQLDNFNSMLNSFDILLSGLSKQETGPALTGFQAITFKDTLSNSAGGLDTSSGDWGQSSYTSNGEFSYELKPGQGPIYDYYADKQLPQNFALQATASYTGTNDNGYGVIFRVVADGKFYVFRISGDGFYTV
ncbi:MAG TPA: clostripain-related cysteine peptidase, partial [Anaerolineae bacterium]|nr:clostripain-related cysteine peptidase [Anaerolineae bacterium]